MSGAQLYALITEFIACRPLQQAGVQIFSRDKNTKRVWAGDEKEGAARYSHTHARPRRALAAESSTNENLFMHEVCKESERREANLIAN